MKQTERNHSSDFDKREFFQEKLESKVMEVLLKCAVHNIPIFVAAATAARGDSYLYQNRASLPEKTTPPQLLVAADFIDDPDAVIAKAKRKK